MTVKIIDKNQHSRVTGALFRNYLTASKAGQNGGIMQ